jgi:nucleotide-binding universal stress UspA family protein
MTPEHLFPTIVVGAAFSPHLDAVLKEAIRLTEKWGKRLVITHVERNKETEAESRLRGAIDSVINQFDKLPSLKIDIVMRGGRVVDELMAVASEESADLMLIGANVHESMLTRWKGSASRRLAREAPCSVMMLPTPKQHPTPFSRIVVAVDESDASEWALATAAALARLEPAEKLTAVWEYRVPGLSAAIAEGRSVEQANALQQQLHTDEEIRLRSFLQTADLYGLPVEAVCLYGEPGWVVNEYAREHAGDLLVIPAPVDHTGLYCRLFPHDEEHVLSDLPCELLLVRQKRQT